MGAQYSTGAVSPDWKGWLEERCSLEQVRATYGDFRVLVSSRREDDGFFITHRDFLRVGQSPRYFLLYDIILRSCITCFGGYTGTVSSGSTGYRSTAVIYVCFNSIVALRAGVNGRPKKTK